MLQTLRCMESNTYQQEDLSQSRLEFWEDHLEVPRSSADAKLDLHFSLRDALFAGVPFAAWASLQRRALAGQQTRQP